MHVMNEYRPLILSLALLVLLGGIGFAGVAYERQRATYPEVQELSGSDRTFQEYSDYFRRLSEDKGAEYAYQVLLRAPLATGTDLHLLGHVVGDMLYKQQGIDGINSCTQDFRNACSHSVVIGILSEHGEGALGEIAKTCKKAPGGQGAYTMCFHGLGHGILAYNGYRLDRAVEMCKRTGTPEYGYQEYSQCVGGASMEMVAGVHDREVWQSQYGNYFSETDPLAPCNQPYMDDAVRPFCYMHLTPRLFEQAGMDLAAPSPTVLPEAFSYCDAIPATNERDRAACYGGFGKEFIVLAQSRDIRQISETDEAALRTVREWCALAGDEQGEDDCNSSALDSLYWGGEIEPDAAFRFCAIAKGGEQAACYQKLVVLTDYFLPRGLQRNKVCERFPEEYQESCKAASLRL